MYSIGLFWRLYLHLLDPYILRVVMYLLLLPSLYSSVFDHESYRSLTPESFW